MNLRNNEQMVISYSDLDLYKFHQLVQQWNLEFTQLQPGVSTIDLTQVILPDLQFGLCRLNLSMRQEGTSPQGMWTFAFVNQAKVYWRNFVVHPKSIIVYAPGSDIHAVNGENFEVLTFSISETLLMEWAHANNCIEYVEHLRNTEVVQTKDPDWSELRNVIANQTNFDKVPKNEKKSKFNLEQYLKRLCALLQQSNASTDRVSSLSRLELLIRAETAMVKNYSEQFSVTNLLASLDVSERTLQYAFNQRYELSPKAFLKVLKLNHVHHGLHDSTDTSVSAIARQSGFWHMGQFSKEYKTFFGELPSETLRKTE